MRLVDKDRNIVVYQLEARWARGGGWHRRNMSPSSFGEKHPPFNGNMTKSCPLYREYGANGECWQTTGLHGYLDEKIARKAFAKLLAKGKPDCEVSAWRLVKRTIHVGIQILIEGKAENR
jgi:hypothetical protein